MLINKIKFTKLFLLLLAFSSITLHVSAAKRYWISANTAGWNNTANWSATSGGSGGATVPASSDTAYFDGNGLGRCDIDANVSIKRFDILNTYTDTITQNGYTLTISNGMSLAAGVFIGSSSTITLTGTYTNTGCNFTSTSGTFEIKEGHFLLTGTSSYLHNNGLLKLTHTATVVDTGKVDLSTSSNDTSFYDFEIYYTISRYFKIPSGGIRVKNNITIGGNNSKYFSSGTIELEGNCTVNGSSYFSAATSTAGTLKFMGSGNQTIYGNGVSTTSQYPHIEIDKPSGTLYLTGIIASKHNWKLTQGNIDAGTSRVYIRDYGQSFTGNFTGNNAFNKLFFVATGNGAVTINDTLEVKDSLVFNRSQVQTYINKGTNAGILCAKGNIAIVGDIFVVGTATLLINGTGTQTLQTGRVLAANITQGVPNITIQKPATDTLKLVGNIVVYNYWIYVSGIINSSQAHILFPSNRSPVITGSHTLNNVEFQSFSSYIITISSGTELTILDSMFMTTNTTNISHNYINTGVINLKGDLYINSTTPYSSGTATLKINGTGNQKIVGSTVDNTYGRLPNVEINKPSGTLYLYNYICIGTNSGAPALNFTHTAGTIDAGTSVLTFANYCNITSNLTDHRLNLNNVRFASGNWAGMITIDAATTLVVNGDFSAINTITSFPNITINGGNVELKGNITTNNVGTVTYGTANILINGTGNQTYTGSSAVNNGFLSKVNIDKPSGTLYLAGTINISNGFTYTAGTVAPGTSTVVMYGVSSGTCTLTGNMNFYNLTFPSHTAYTYNIAAGNTLTANGTLRFLGPTAYNSTYNTGTIAAKGDIVVDNVCPWLISGGSATILINGTSNQTFTGSGIVSTGLLPKILIDKPSGTLYLASIISCGNDWTYVAGNVDATTYSSTVYLWGPRNLDAQGSGSTMSFHNLTIGYSVSTQTGNLQVANNLVINTGATLAQGSYDLSFGGYTNNGTHSGTGPITLIGSGYHTFTKSGGATSNFANVTVNRTGGSLKLASPLNVTTSMTMSKGVVKTDATNLLKFADNATVSGGSDSSYIHGPVIKTGNDGFTFPLGDTSISTSGKYHPLTISAPSVTTDAFTASYTHSQQTQGWNS